MKAKKIMDHDYVDYLIFKNNKVCYSDLKIKSCEYPVAVNKNILERLFNECGFPEFAIDYIRENIGSRVRCFLRKSFEYEFVSEYSGEDDSDYHVFVIELNNHGLSRSPVYKRFKKEWIKIMNL